MADLSYAETVRWKMRSGDSPGGVRYSIRDLSNLTGYSYEHMRKIVKGLPVVSEELNIQLCEILGLDPALMWRQATKEKLAHRYPDIPTVELLPVDLRIAELWTQLSPDQHERLITVARGWAEENRMASSGSFRDRDAKARTA